MVFPPRILVLTKIFSDVMALENRRFLIQQKKQKIQLGINENELKTRKEKTRC
jgi:hypothetical protein